MFPYANLFAIIFLIALIPLLFIVLAKFLGAYQKVHDRLQDSFDKSERERNDAAAAYLHSQEYREQHNSENVHIL